MTGVQTCALPISDVNRDEVANTVVRLIDDLKQVLARMKNDPVDQGARNEYAVVRAKLYNAFLIVSKCWEASADRMSPPAPRNEYLDAAMKYAQKAIILVPDGEEARASIERIRWRFDHAPAASAGDSGDSASIHAVALSNSEIDSDNNATMKQTVRLAADDSDDPSEPIGAGVRIPRWGVGFGFMFPQASGINDYESSAALTLAFRLGLFRKSFWTEGALSFPLMKNQSDSPDISSNLYFATVSGFYAPNGRRSFYGVLGLSIGYEEVRDQSQIIEKNVAPLFTIGLGSSWLRDSFDGRLTYSVPFGARNADGFLALGVTYYFL